MSVKKSSLEQRWYYRVAKVFFLILPILIALLILLNGKVTVCGVLQKSIPDFLLKYLVYIVTGLVLYYLILKGIWRGFLYIVFGGLEDDTKKEGSEQPASAKPKPSKTAELIPLIILFIVFAIFVLSQMGYITLPKIDLDNVKLTPGSNVKLTPGSACPATSAQTATPCRSTQKGVGVGGVIVYDYCDCPSDTTYSGTTDVVTPGGPYKICTCN